MSARSSPTMEVPEAAAAIGVSAWAAYRSIREGTFPLPVIRVGRRIVVPRAPLERLLGISDGPGAA